MSSDTNLYTIPNSEVLWGLHVHFNKVISKLSTNLRGNLVLSACFGTSLSIFRRGRWTEPGPWAHTDGRALISVLFTDTSIFTPLSPRVLMSCALNQLLICVF